MRPRLKGARPRAGRAAPGLLLALPALTVLLRLLVVTRLRPATTAGPPPIPLPAAPANNTRTSAVHSRASSSAENSAHIRSPKAAALSVSDGAPVAKSFSATPAKIVCRVTETPGGAERASVGTAASASVPVVNA